MRRQVITDNSVEKIEIVDDGERYALIRQIYVWRVKRDKLVDPYWSNESIVLNPKEARAIADFIKKG